jgi:callose synthase
MSRLYVGKEVHESFSHTIVLVFFWITMMAWKPFFSYTFEVYSIVLPTVQLTVEYLNDPNRSFAKMVVLLSIR